MTSEGFGKIFEDVFVDPCANIFFAGVNGGLSGVSSMLRPRSKEPHRRQRKYFLQIRVVLGCILEISFKLFLKSSCGEWWVWWCWWLYSKFSDQIWLELSLGQAEH
jgi:hypothetical protein